MKKWSYLLSGILIGAVVATAGNAFADQIKTLVGQTVVGEYRVTVNGAALSDNAIVVDGKAHVPLREVSNSLGAKINVNGKTVEINTETTLEREATPTIQVESSTGLDPYFTKDKLEENKKFWEELLNKSEASKSKMEKDLDSVTARAAKSTESSPQILEARNNSIESLKQGIEKSESLIADYKAKIAEIDTQLAKLNK